MNQAVPEISAILICYNGLKFLPDCLRTLTEDLAEISHELIIIDNGSTDRSIDFIKANYPNAKLIENGSNLGFAKAVNIGLAKGQGSMLYVLNQDLRFHKGATRSLITRLQEDETIGLIGPKYIGFDGQLQWSVRAFPSYRHVFYRALFLDRLFPKHKEFSSWRMGWFDHEQELFVDQPMGAVMLIPRKVYEAVGGMDEKFWLLFNDVDLCRRIALAGFKRLYYPKAVVEHFVGGSTSRIPYRLKLVSHWALFRYLAKYARPYEYPLLLLAGLVLAISLPPLLLAAWLRRLI